MVQHSERAMANDPATSLSSSRTWFTPKRLLAVLCAINLLNYMDRGTIASNGVNGSARTCDSSGTCSSGSGIQGDFNLNNFEVGIIPSAFMVGLLLASPIFTSLAKSINPCRLIGVGLTVWTIAITFCGFSFSFWSIVISRMLVGVGEASFVSFAAPFIDDSAPAAQRSAWLGAYYMCLPTGTAIGYAYGGLVGQFNWRWAFWLEAILMLPFAITGFVMAPLQLKGLAPSVSKLVLAAVEDVSEEVADDSLKSSKLTVLTIFWREMKALMLEKVYVVNLLAYIVYFFVLGAFSYWGPKAGYNIYHMSNADYLFGGITAACGILGTLGGGFILDNITSTITNAFKLLSVGTLFGTICLFGSFCFTNLYAYLVVLAMAQLLLFGCQAPVNFISLHCVKPSLRPLSMAISAISIHVFGDVPSPTLVGLVQDNVNNWRETVLVLAAILFLGVGLWFIGIFLHSVDRYDEDSKSSTTPLLEENTIAVA